MVSSFHFYYRPSRPYQQRAVRPCRSNLNIERNNVMSLDLNFFICKMSRLDKNTWFLKNLVKAMALLPTKNVHTHNMTWILWACGLLSSHLPSWELLSQTFSNVFSGSDGLLMFKPEIKLKDRRPRLHRLAWFMNTFFWVPSCIFYPSDYMVLCHIAMFQLMMDHICNVGLVSIIMELKNSCRLLTSQPSSRHNGKAVKKQGCG